MLADIPGSEETVLLKLVLDWKYRAGLSRGPTSAGHARRLFDKLPQDQHFHRSTLLGEMGVTRKKIQEMACVDCSKQYIV